MTMPMPWGCWNGGGPIVSGEALFGRLEAGVDGGCRVKLLLAPFTIAYLYVYYLRF